MLPVLLGLKAMSHEAIFSCNLQRNWRFKLHFSREIASCNASGLQNNPTAGHTTTCICLQFYRSLQYLFHPNLRCKLQEKIASCDMAFKERLYISAKFQTLHGSSLNPSTTTRSQAYSAGHKLPGGRVNFFSPSKGRVIKKLNYQKGESHKFKPTLYDSFILLKVQKQITVIDYCILIK